MAKQPTESSIDHSLKIVERLLDKIKDLEERVKTLENESEGECFNPVTGRTYYR